MNKDQSLQLKGVAILMMLWLHLFNTQERVEECTTLINYLNGKPLAYAIARMCGMCVPIYLFISGYGMAKASEMNVRSTLRRLWRVYSRFWLVFALFIPLACWIKPEAYPNGYDTLLLNVLSLDVSYNEEWWFLLPWAILIATAKWIVPFVRRNNIWVNLIVFFVLFLLLIEYKWPVLFLGNNPFSILLSRLMLVMPAFYVGVCVGNYGWCSLVVRSLKWPSLIMLTLCMVRGLLGPSLVNVLFAVPIILLFTLCCVPQWLCSVLRFFGHYSIYMWLTHTFFAYYLFHDALYGLRYPIVIYMMLVFVSLFTAIMLAQLYNLLEAMLTQKKKI